MPTRSVNRPAIAMDLETAIILVRGARVMLDADLAQLYGVGGPDERRGLRRVAENRSCVSRRKQSVGTIELGGPQCSVYLGLLRCRQRSAQPSR
jgi:hypothetical protein